MKLINNIFSSDVAFNLRREDDSSLQTCDNGEVGVSGRDYALVPGEMWIQALKWLVSWGIFGFTTEIHLCVFFFLIFALESFCCWWIEFESDVNCA